MILKDAEAAYYGGDKIKKIYLGEHLVYSLVIPPPPVVAEDEMQSSNSAVDYIEGSTSWGDLTLSSGCNASKDGVEMQQEETYLSAVVSGVSYPMSFEFKGRVDSGSYKLQANNPGMLFGFGPTQNGWGDGVTCYATTDYGIIVDAKGAMAVVTQKMPTYVHIVVVIDSNGAMKVYMNGNSNSWSYAGDVATKSSKNYFFNGQGLGRFVGAINTMRWWNGELTVSEIEELYSGDDSKYKEA